MQSRGVDYPRESIPDVHRQIDFNIVIFSLFSEFSSAVTLSRHKTIESFFLPLRTFNGSPVKNLEKKKKASDCGIDTDR